MKHTPKVVRFHPRRAGKESDPEFQAEMDKFRKVLGMKLQEQMEQELWSAPLPETPNAVFDFDALRSLIASYFAFPDPLDLKGIGKDWICVVHPVMLRELENLESREGLDLLSMTVFNRPIFVNYRVPQDRWQFVSPQSARELFTDDADIQRYLDRQNRDNSEHR